MARKNRNDRLREPESLIKLLEPLSIKGAAISADFRLSQYELRRIKGVPLHNLDGKRLRISYDGITHPVYNFMTRCGCKLLCTGG